MISEWDLWAAANEVIRQHGDNALKFAALRQASMVDNDDQRGFQVWQQIILKIVELQRKPAPGEIIQ